jgi:hypothetical protein
MASYEINLLSRKQPRSANAAAGRSTAGSNRVICISSRRPTGKCWSADDFCLKRCMNCIPELRGSQSAKISSNMMSVLAIRCVNE